MKKHFIFGLLIVATACTMNDPEDTNKTSRKDLKGPAAKNTPVWKRLSTPVVVRSTDSLKKKWGGAIKNALPWPEKESQKYQSLVRRSKQKLQGPRAKNRRP